MVSSDDTLDSSERLIRRNRELLTHEKLVREAAKQAAAEAAELKLVMRNRREQLEQDAHRLPVSSFAVEGSLAPGPVAQFGQCHKKRPARRLVRSGRKGLDD